METAIQSKLRATLQPALACVAAALVSACTGAINDPRGEREADRASDTRDGEPSAGTDGAAGKGVAGASGSARAAGSDGTGPEDVGRVGIHRLNNLEYDNTVRDLLGVSATPASTFIADEKALGFDTIAEAFGMTEAQYEQYFNAADALVEAAFVDDALRARIVTCAPDAATDTSCTEQIVRAFGARAVRRPLEEDDVTSLVRLAQDARGLGATFEESIAQVAKALMSSVPFLYRLELDPDPSSSEPRPLDGYELASRLSYLLWSTMPDAELFTLAESGELTRDETLRAQLARMLSDPRSRMFVESFAGQWLGLRELQSHRVNTEQFPAWSDSLREAMVAEGFLYFEQLLSGELAMTEFFTAEVSFVTSELADLYGLIGEQIEGALEPVRVDGGQDGRRGFLGLASFLTLTSFSHRTAPTLRGKWVLEKLLCEIVPPPPPNVPELDEETEPGVDLESLNVRERLAEHRANPTCAGCHRSLDPIGLALEHFDAIGRYRDQYAGGDPIDASGMLPSGEIFDGLSELSALLAEDERLLDCAVQKLLTYALSRELAAGDEPYIAALRERWVASGAELGALLEQIVLSEPFRNRRGEGAP